MENTPIEHEPGQLHGQDENIRQGGSSISPTLSSVHAVILIYLEELAFYLVELDVLGASN